MGRRLERFGRAAGLALLRPLLGRRRPLEPGALAAAAFPAERILLVRVDRLGDLVVSTPAVAAFRARFPTARITLLVSPRGAPVAGWVPGVDEVLVFDRKDPGSWPGLWRRLRRQRFDLAFDLNTAFSNTALLLARLSGARRAGTYDDPRSRAWYDVLFPVDVEGHQLRTHRGVGAILGVAAPQLPVLDIPAGVPEIARQFLGRHGIGDQDRVVVLNPNLTREYYRWPLERFAALGDRAAAAGARVLVSCAGAGERERAEAVARAMREPAAVLPGDWPLRDYARFLRRVSAFVSAMTGPVHLCEALRVPVVGLSTPRQAPGWRPLGEEHRIVVSPTAEVAGIGVEAAWKELRSVLDGCAGPGTAIPGAEPQPGESDNTSAGGE